MKTKASLIAGSIIVLAAIALLTPIVKVNHGVGHRQYRATFSSLPPEDCTVSYALVHSRDVPTIRAHHPLREIRFITVDDPTHPLEFDVRIISKETIPPIGKSEYSHYLQHDTLLVMYEYTDGNRIFQPLALPGRELPHVIIPPIAVETHRE